MADTLLELTLPTGWTLSDSAGCQLDVVRGCLWLTDQRGKDFWLKDGDRELLTSKTLLSAECETVIRLKPAHAWEFLLQVDAKYKRTQLRLKTLSFWLRCSHLLQYNTLFRKSQQEQSRL